MITLNFSILLILRVVYCFAHPFLLHLRGIKPWIKKRLLFVLAIIVGCIQAGKPVFCRGERINNDDAIDTNPNTSLGNKAYTLNLKYIKY
jgi:hypothetical protein